MRYQRKTVAYEALAQETFQAAEPMIYEVQWEGVGFEFLINWKPNLDQAVVFGTGALGTARDTWPIFSRASWMEDLPGSGIWYFDPSVYLGDVALCWGYGTNDRWYLENIAYLLHVILEKLSISMERTLFCGSSGGGFTSIALAAMLHGKALAINPQFDVRNYWSSSVEKLKAAVLRETEQLIDARIDLALLMQREGFFPQIHLYQNIWTKADVELQLLAFLREICRFQLPCQQKFEVEFFCAEGGHSVMPSKEETLRLIAAGLALPLIAGGDVQYPAQSFFHRLQSGKISARQMASANDLVFQAVNIPAPKRHFKDAAAIAAAQQLQQGTLRVLPSLPSVPFSPDAPDWNIKVANAENAFQLYLQALNPVQVLTQAFLQTEDSALLAFAAQLIRSWWRYASNDALRGDNPHAWSDHATALRTENLIYFSTTYRSSGLCPDAEYRQLAKILQAHGARLCNDAYYKQRHNHGMMQDRALLHVGFLLGERDWIAHARQRLQEQALWAFNDEAVHKENSPGYVGAVITLLTGIGTFLKEQADPLGDELLGKMVLTQAYLDWVTEPNGLLARIGDTHNATGALRAMQRKSAEQHQIYPHTGCYFYRSDLDDLCQNDTWKTIKSGYESTTHKHADDCSFLLYSKGYEVFTDGGSYGNIRDDFRKYFLSANAHNVVVVDEQSYPCDLKHKQAVGLSGYGFFPDYDHIRVLNCAYPGVVFERNFCSADDLTIVFDRLSSNVPHTYAQLFHLSKQMKVLYATGKEVLLQLSDSGYVVRLRQYGEPAKLTVIHGNRAQAGYGLSSQKTNQIDEITTLKFELSGSRAVFATAITIEDGNGAVRLFQRREKADALHFDAVTHTFTLQNLQIPCLRALQADGSAVDRPSEN
ncbi:MAG: heparinase II/III family protein [Oscillospiraceae bacterium]|nr:heparinase II/III family protein [Oscillospiraceae bacterium]